MAAKDTTKPDPENAKHIIVEARKEVVTGKGVADTVLCSPDFYASILEGAGDKFNPIMNDKINATGNVGNWLGFNFIEAPQLSAVSKFYYDHTGAKKTVSFENVDFIMYNHRTLSIIPNFESARIIPSEHFTGSKAQVELNVGYRVRNKSSLTSTSTSRLDFERRISSVQYI